MANQPNQAKRDVRAFERWFYDASRYWSPDLIALGTRALLALKTLDQPDVPDVMVREAAKDMADFLAANAARIAKGE